MDYVAVLPTEIIEKIFSHLQLRELLACSEVCKRWYHIANSIRLWKPFVSSFDYCGGNSSELQKYNAITTNFVDPSCGLAAIITSKSLSPVNPCKNLIRQRNILKYNWSHGIYEVHTLEPQEYKLTTFSQVRTNFPSKAPQDCLYYPILGTRENGEEGVYLIRLDAKPRIVSTLIETVNEDSDVEIACVMSDCVVWIVGLTVQWFSLQSDFKNPKVQTLGNVDKNEYMFLTMDDDHIIAWSHKWLYIWCKKTLNLKLSRNSPLERTISSVCLNGGLCIVTCFMYHERVSSIEVNNIRNNVEHMLQHEFVVEGRVIDVKCSKNFILIQYEHRFEVRSKNMAEIIYSLSLRTEIFQVINDFAFFHASRAKFIMQLDISNGESDDLNCRADLDNVHFLFDNIFIATNCIFLGVWDWVKGVKINQFWTGHLIEPFLIHVSETRVLTLDPQGIIRIYGFG